MDENQRFLLEKIRDGLANGDISLQMTDEDMERLRSCVKDYKKIPREEWEEWTEKIHHALKRAFTGETMKLENKEKVNEWRNRCMAVVKNTLLKDPEEQIILEGAILHFVEEDLLNHVIDTIGYDNLTNEEKKMADMLSDRSGYGRRKVYMEKILLPFIIFALLFILYFLILK